MPPIQLVFLFDLNVFSDDHSKTKEHLSQKLLCLRLACLRILTYYSNHDRHLKWGFKFFNSCGSLTQDMCKFSFPCVSLENYEIFENEVCMRYQRHFDIEYALSKRSDINCSTDIRQTFPNKILQLALTQILYEYHWENNLDMFSSTRIPKKSRKKNFLFLMTKIPSDPESFSAYFGADFSSMTVSKLSKLILSSSLYEQFLVKASIQWAWLTTNDEKDGFRSSKSSVSNMIAQSLKHLHTPIISLTILCQLNTNIKFSAEGCDEQSSNTLHSSLLPFSAFFKQCFSHSFNNNKRKESKECVISFENSDEINIDVTQLPLQWYSSKISSAVNEKALKKGESQINGKSHCNSSSLDWVKFTVRFAMSKAINFQPTEMILCMPTLANGKASVVRIKKMLKNLVFKAANLFVVCEKNDGIQVPGVLTALSDTSAVIMVCNAKASLGHRQDVLKRINMCNLFDLKKCSASNVSSAFQMDFLETWYHSNSSVDITGHYKHLKNTKSKNLDSFHKQLKKISGQVSLKPVCESKFIEETAHVSTEVLDSEIKDIQIPPVSTLNYEQLITVLRELYDTSISSGNVLGAAKSIVKTASSFFMQKSIASYEENMKSFMLEYFCITSKSLCQKYGDSQDPDTINKKIIECQLQTVLALELEMLFPSCDNTNCVDTAASFLRVMSFYSGATELHRLLCDVLKENYIEYLYDVLIEIGDEMDIPLFPDEDSSPIEEPSSVITNDASSSVASSSIMSNSDLSSRGDSRKLKRHRSDISESNQSRQILLLKTSPRKKKSKRYSEFDHIPIRYSPRLASRKKKDRSKPLESKPENVRRNLFPKDRKPQTPRFGQTSVLSPNKRRLRTPHGYHVLKTKYVAETPFHKQDRSALQRRKSQRNIDTSELGSSVKDVEESPHISKSSEDPNSMILLQKIKEKSALSASSSRSLEKSQPSTSYNQYTPDSKRRLSLKLFSKIFTSPTMRMGLKRCSKRLFDQASPHVKTTDSKRMRYSPACDDSQVKSEYSSEF